MSTFSENACRDIREETPSETQRRSDLHLISILDVNLSDVISLCKAADIFKKIVKSRGGCDILRHRVLASYFNEPSTRTSCSFHAAMVRLGGNVINVSDNNSSSKKGETLNDTIQTLSSYCDAIVLRHSCIGSAANSASISSIPVINAGDGTGEHPSQALLDVYTILTELGHIGDYYPFSKNSNNINNLNVQNKEMKSSNIKSTMTIVVVGDLKNGRTVHSLVQLLAQFKGIKFIFVSPPNLGMPDRIIEFITKLGAKVAFTTNLTDEIVSVDQNNNFYKNNKDALSQADVIYMTRIQKERFENENEYNKVKGSYVLNKKLLGKAKSEGNLIVMHPLPRVDEIHVDVDADPRAAYFRQMENGMYMRMALLHWVILGKLIPDQNIK